MAKCKFEKNNFNITFLNFYNLYKRNFDYSLFILIISYSPGRIYVTLYGKTYLDALANGLKMAFSKRSNIVKRRLESVRMDAKRRLASVRVVLNAVHLSVRTPFDERSNAVFLAISTQF